MHSNLFHRKRTLARRPRFRKCWTGFERVRKNRQGELNREIVRVGRFHSNMHKEPTTTQRGMTNEQFPWTKRASTTFSRAGVHLILCPGGFRRGRCPHWDGFFAGFMCFVLLSGPLLGKRVRENRRRPSVWKMASDQILVASPACGTSCYSASIGDGFPPNYF